MRTGTCLISSHALTPITRLHRARIAARSTRQGKSILTLRHTFACRKLIETRDIYLLRNFREQSSAETTERQLKLPEGYLAEPFRVGQSNGKK